MINPDIQQMFEKLFSVYYKPQIGMPKARYCDIYRLDEPSCQNFLDFMDIYEKNKMNIYAAYTQIFFKVDDINRIAIEDREIIKKLNITLNDIIPIILILSHDRQF